MKNIILLITLFLCISKFSYSQHSTIQGTVKDEAGKPIDLVNLKLISLPDSNKIAAHTSSEKGTFHFKHLANGNYVLIAQQIGYQKYFSAPISIQSSVQQNIDIELKTIDLKTKEVSIIAQKPLVRIEDGKTIVDVENTMGNAGQSAVEVLRKAPGVAINQDGKIELRGKSGVQVMIDDKVMYLSEDQLNNLLKSIQAENIKEIEIITSPSAKYDAAGNGGIINIKLKKGAYEGLNGSTNTSYGSGVYHKATPGANITYKKNKLTLNSGLQYANKIGLSEFSNYRVNSDVNELNNRYSSKSYYKLPSQSVTYTLNGEYRVTEKTSFTYDFNNSYGVYDWAGTTNSSLFTKYNTLNSSYFGDDKGKESYLNIYSSLGFKHQFDTNGTKINAYGAYNNNHGWENKNMSIQYYDSLSQNTNNPFLFLFNMNSKNESWNGQADYEMKIWKKVKFEAGAKANSVQNYKPNLIKITENQVQRNADNLFKYKQNIYALYSMGTTTLGKWNLQAGLRFERTEVYGSLSQIDCTFTRSHNDFFPSGNVTFKQSDKTSYTLAYSRRITRPEGDQLNPVLNILDPFSAWGGDPYLKPQYTDNTELSYSIFESAVITTVNYAYVKNPILWVNKIQAGGNKLISGPRNMDYQQSAGLNLAINFPVKKVFSTNNNFFGGFNRFVGNSDFGTIDNQRSYWGFKSTQTFNLPKEIGIEIGGSYDSPSSYAFSTSYERYQLNLAIQKKIWAKKGLIKLAVNDMFWTFQYGGSSEMGTTSQKGNYYWDNRTLILRDCCKTRPTSFPSFFWEVSSNGTKSTSLN